MKQFTMILLVALVMIVVGCEAVQSVHQTVGGQLKRNLTFLGAIPPDNNHFVERSGGRPPKRLSYKEAQMEKARNGPVSLGEFHKRELGLLKYELSQKVRNGEEAFIVSAYLLEYEGNRAPVLVRSMFYDRFDEHEFRRMVDRKLEEMYPSVETF